MRSWQLQDAKAKLSEVVKEATSRGPQKITVHGKPEVIVISCSDYDKLSKPKVSFAEFMQRSPLKGVTLDIKRDQSKNRDINL